MNRNWILAWTSLWIYLPAMIHLLQRDWFAFVLLSASGSFSILHWLDNKPYSVNHCLDIAFGVANVIRIGWSVYTFPFLGFFCVQRWLQIEKDVDWETVTVVHLCFRYIGFWMAMTICCSWNTINWLVLPLSFVYALHIMYLWA